MPIERLEKTLASEIAALDKAGTGKRRETVIAKVVAAAGKAAAGVRAVDILDGPRGRELLAHLGAMTQRFESGLIRLGFETIPGEHPVVPLMVRDTQRTSALVAHLRKNGILATGLNFPVVPRGDEEIRFQVSADHTEADIDEALAVLAGIEASA